MSTTEQQPDFSEPYYAAVAEDARRRGEQPDILSSALRAAAGVAVKQNPARITLPEGTRTVTFHNAEGRVLGGGTIPAQYEHVADTIRHVLAGGLFPALTDPSEAQAYIEYVASRVAALVMHGGLSDEDIREHVYWIEFVERSLDARDGGHRVPALTFKVNAGRTTVTLGIGPAAALSRVALGSL